MRRIPWLFGSWLSAVPAGLAGESSLRWPAQVAAVFDHHCVKCHGPLEQKNGLTLDTAESALKGGDDGPVIAPGKPDESALVKALAPEADPHMPPKKQLNADEIMAIRTWVASLADQPARVTASDRTTNRVPRSIDEFLAVDWEAAGVTPAPLADDRTFLRRAFLDLIGRIPTPAEVEAFLYDGAPDKRAALVDRLLGTDEAARNFREVWDALLMGRRGGRREERRRDNGWFAFLENSFKTGRPWNEVVATLITARPEKPEDKGAIWFVYERRNEHQQIAEAIAPVIYGTRVDCAQCHDHPLAREIKQGHYWGLVAAFNRSKNVERGTPAVSESAVGGFINFTNLKKESQPAVLAMLTGATIEEARPEPGTKEEDAPDRYIEAAGAVKVPKFSRRGALALAATVDNPLLARSFVNHSWALLLGRGIVQPVDEMNSKNPPSHPALFEWLAQEFAAHHFEVKWLIRTIVLSRAYQLDAWSGPAPPPPVESFAAAMEKPLTGESIARSTRLAVGRPADDEALRQACVERFPDVLPRVTRATLQQAMFLANSEPFTSIFAGAPLAETLAHLPTPAERVRAGFRHTLARDPQPDELACAVAFLEAHPGAPAEAAGQLLWSLVSGPEFLTNH